MLIAELNAVLLERTPPEFCSHMTVEQMADADTTVFVARDDGGRAVACGALRRHDDGVGEVKRMYTVPARAGAGNRRADPGADRDARARGGPTRGSCSRPATSTTPRTASTSAAGSPVAARCSTTRTPAGRSSTRSRSLTDGQSATGCGATPRPVIAAAPQRAAKWTASCASSPFPERERETCHERIAAPVGVLSRARQRRGREGAARLHPASERARGRDDELAAPGRDRPRGSAPPRPLRSRSARRARRRRAAGSRRRGQSPSARARAAPSAAPRRPRR